MSSAEIVLSVPVADAVQDWHETVVVPAAADGPNLRDESGLSVPFEQSEGVHDLEASPQLLEGQPHTLASIAPHFVVPYGPGAPLPVIDALQGSTLFDVDTVLNMHRELNDDAFKLLAEGTDVLQILEDETTYPKECTICLETLEAGQIVTRVQCMGEHVFHQDCLNTWMATKLYNEQPAFCPNCNFKILDPLHTREPPRATRQQIVPMKSRRFALVMIVLVVIVIVCAVAIPKLFGTFHYRWNRNRDQDKSKT